MKMRSIEVKTLKYMIIQVNIDNCYLSLDYTKQVSGIFI